MGPTEVRDEVFGAMRLAVERLTDEGQALDAVAGALAREGEVDDARLEELCPYFGVIWPSARALAEVVADLGREGLAGRRVLELGCGLAAPSLVAGLLGAEVLATDYHPDVPVLLARNRARNAAPGVRYQAVDLRREDDVPRGFDLVLAADVNYVPDLPPRVARAIDLALAPGGRAVVTDPGRPYLQGFADLAAARGLRCALEVRTVADPPRTRDVFVLTLTRG
ncbi:MAG: methyltransferase domain-containing protein [Planctomycetes bacterium]|nr:methyltransferase domain-containing protein [Planctomycetota bacterium]